jgi:hypothetical protein
LVRRSNLPHAISSFNQELRMNTKDRPKLAAAGIFISKQVEVAKQDAGAMVPVKVAAVPIVRFPGCDLPTQAKIA